MEDGLLAGWSGKREADSKPNSEVEEEGGELKAQRADTRTNLVMYYFQTNVRGRDRLWLVKEKEGERERRERERK